MERVQVLLSKAWRLAMRLIAEDMDISKHTVLVL